MEQRAHVIVETQSYGNFCLSLENSETANKLMTSMEDTFYFANKVKAV